jgi:hypothetical protein
VLHDRKYSGRDFDRAIGGGGGVGCCLVMISFSSKVFALSSLRVLFKVNLVAKLHLFELIPIKVEGRKRLNFQEYRNGLNIVKN